MRANFSHYQDAILKRAAKASLVVLVICGGFYTWHAVSAERTAVRAEQARQAALRMTPKKLAALERETSLDAAATAFAEKQRDEQQARAHADEHARDASRL